MDLQHNNLDIFIDQNSEESNLFYNENDHNSGNMIKSPLNKDSSKNEEISL
jgi:hypothetical protein